jgi:hypothetical protein
MEFILIPALALYTLISFITVICAIIFAIKRKKNAWLWGGVAAFIMYSLLFWDWIPTVAVKQYYCSTQAGFWVYKTADQWKAENPEILATLSKPLPTGSPKESKQLDGGQGEVDTFHRNERFDLIVKRQDMSQLLPIIRKEEIIRDVKKNEVLARYVDFSTGHLVENKTTNLPGAIKLWLNSQHCRGGGINDDAFWKFSENFNGEK